MPDPAPASLQELVGDAIRDAIDLARQELTLFRVETTENLTKMARGAAMFGVAAVFAIGSLIWFTQAAVYALNIVLRPWASALIVGAVLALVALVLALLGKSWLSAATLTPRHTVRSLKRDSEILSERTVG